jgi:hypothetical protein
VVWENTPEERETTMTPKARKPKIKTVYTVTVRDSGGNERVRDIVQKTSALHVIGQEVSKGCRVTVEITHKPVLKII